MKSHGVTIQMKATEQYFPVLFIMLYKVDLICESVDEIQKFYHSNDLLQFSPNRRQVASRFKYVRNLYDIAALIRTEIAACLLATFIASSSAKNYIENCNRNCTKIVRVNRPLAKLANYEDHLILVTVA